MSFISTTNSVPTTNPSTPIQFITQNIQDPAVQQNFEILNRVLANKLQGKDISQANIVFSPAPSSGRIVGNSTSLQTLGDYQVQITTRGNPVRVKLAPFASSTSNISKLGIISTTNSISANFGWQRTVNGITTTICTQVVSAIGTLDAGTSTLQYFISLPAFEVDDVVPSGTYLYQFFFQLADTHQTLNISNVNVVAYELR